jgi:hypothetical protein
MADQEQWVIWNGSLGILMMVAIGRIEQAGGGRQACLAPPYDMVGPFDLDELEIRGRIAFGECLVMSRQRWQQDQLALRIAAFEERRAFFPMQPDVDDDDQELRTLLNLPRKGALDPSQITASFRTLAKTAHPDAGGSADQYRRIAAARDALLRQFGRTS